MEATRQSILSEHPDRMVCDYSALAPHEIWAEIFSYLSYKETTPVALVCHDWHQISLRRRVVPMSQLKTWFPDISFIDEKDLEDKLAFSKHKIPMCGIPLIDTQKFIQEIKSLIKMGIQQSQINVVTMLAGLSFNLFYQAAEEKGLKFDHIGTMNLKLAEQVSEVAYRAILITNVEGVTFGIYNQVSADQYELENVGYNIAEPLATSLMAIIKPPKKSQTDQEGLLSMMNGIGMDLFSSEPEPIASFAFNGSAVVAGKGTMQKNLQLIQN